MVSEQVCINEDVVLTTQKGRKGRLNRAGLLAACDDVRPFTHQLEAETCGGSLE